MFCLKTPTFSLSLCFAPQLMSPLVPFVTVSLSLLLFLLTRPPTLGISLSLVALFDLIVMLWVAGKHPWEPIHLQHPNGGTLCHEGGASGHPFKACGFVHIVKIILDSPLCFIHLKMKSILQIVIKMYINLDIAQHIQEIVHNPPFFSFKKK